MKKRSIRPNRPVYPTPAALITSASENGRANIITLGEVFNISVDQPVILGIAIRKGRHSHQLISFTRQFGVNFPTSAMAEVVDRCGGCSGRDVDKFQAFGLTPVPSEKIRPPLIAECPLCVECEVIGIQEIGDHDLFLGEAVAQHVAGNALTEDGRIRVEALDPLCYVLGEYWDCGRKLARHGFTRR